MTPIFVSNYDRRYYNFQVRNNEIDVKVSALGYVWFFLFEHTCFFYEQLSGFFFVAYEIICLFNLLPLKRCLACVYFERLTLKLCFCSF